MAAESASLAQVRFPSERGAYGLRLTGIADGPALVQAQPDWPALRIVTGIGEPLVTRERLTDGHALLRLKTGGRMTLDRRSGVAHYTVPRRLTGEELAHP